MNLFKHLLALTLGLSFSITALGEQSTTWAKQTKGIRVSPETPEVTQSFDMEIPYIVRERHEKGDSEKTLKTFARKFIVNVKGAKLQYFEYDQVEVTAGITYEDVVVNAGPFNTYKYTMSHSGNITTINLIAEKRNFVLLPKDITLGAFVVVRGGLVGLSVAVDSKYVPPAGGTDKLYLYYRVEGCKLDFTGFCNFSKYKTVDEGEVEFNQPIDVIPFKLDANYKIKVYYSFTRKGSSWYDGSYPPESVTEEFVFKP